MHFIHQSLDGERMFVAQMTDTHLLNYLKLMLTKLERALEIGTSATVMSPEQQAIYGIDVRKLQKRQRNNVPKDLAAMFPYLSEAMLRWWGKEDKSPTATAMSDVVRRLRAVMGRDSQMERLSLTSALPEGASAMTTSGYRRNAGRRALRASSVPDSVDYDDTDELLGIE